MGVLTWSFRIILFIGSVVVFSVISRCIRKRKIQVRDGIFWIVISFLLILVSVFPGIVASVSKFIGIQSMSNCVFFFIIFLFGCHQFYLTIRISQLDMKNSKLAQHIAIQEALENEGEDH